MNHEVKMPHRTQKKSLNNPSPVRVVYNGKKLQNIKKKKWRDRTEPKFPSKVETLDQLLYVAWNYQGDKFDWFTLWNMIPPLTELNNVVGLENLKKEVVSMIIYYIQGLHLPSKNNLQSKDSDILHTVLYGKPGVGKSMIAGILAKIYCRMGFLPTEKVISVKRSDFIGKYIGHTEEKTSNILKSAIGGVLFIDEAYSMGHEDKTDSFSKGAVDLLNQFLTEHNGECICIIAGYEKDLNESFFSINKGLNSRFPSAFRFHIEDYSPSELHEIFVRKVQENGWSLEKDSIDKNFFSTNLKYFPAFGRDIGSFFTSCKRSHSSRIFGIENPETRLLTKEDIENALENFSKNSKKSEEVPSELKYVMYS